MLIVYEQVDNKNRSFIFNMDNIISFNKTLRADNSPALCVTTIDCKFNLSYSSVELLDATMDLIWYSHNHKFSSINISEFNVIKYMGEEKVE